VSVLGQPVAHPPEASPAPIAEDPGKGTMFVKLEERSPLSSINGMYARFSERARNKAADYDLADETFKLIVPESYDPEKPAGLMVYVTPGEPAAAIGEKWVDVLATHNMIFIAAVNSANEREIWHRFGLALDAQHNVIKQYKIDKKRVYISGVSGGGRVASRLGITYAEVFDGAMPMCGCDHFDILWHPTQAGWAWKKKFNAPKREILNLGKTYGRYVFITGEKDENRLQTLQTATAYRQLGFAYSSYIEVPGMEHTIPPAEVFEEGIVALDEPLEKMRK